MSKLQEPSSVPVFRFSVRLLLLAIAIVALPLAWKFNRVHRQQVVADELGGMNATLQYNNEEPQARSDRQWIDKSASRSRPAGSWLGPHVSVDLITVVADDPHITDATLRRIANVSTIQAIDLKSDQITDDGVAHLQRMPNLTALALESTAITDSGLSHLKGIKRLSQLWLKCPSISDAGLEHIGALTQLSLLHIEAQNVTDTGIMHLAALEDISRIELWGTQLTDSGLAFVRPIRDLFYISIVDTPITDACVSDLQHASWVELFNTRISEEGLKRISGSAVCLPPIRPN